MSWEAAWENKIGRVLKVQGFSLETIFLSEPDFFFFSVRWE